MNKNYQGPLFGEQFEGMLTLKESVPAVALILPLGVISTIDSLKPNFNITGRGKHFGPCYMEVLLGVRTRSIEFFA